MQQATSRYKLIRDGEQLALWHFHETEAEFISWFPTSGPEEDIDRVIEEHSHVCSRRDMRPSEEFDS